ncbi:MAG: hypothetical protein JNL60_00275, partial [Bacteroidia bacterium]|nr:hypothetical protein [Bacteroidia bacterium]
NVIGGYAKGLNGFEAGCIFNIDERSVKGVQLAGVFNIVGHTAQGTQCAGLFNIVGESFKGFQAAGLMNINDGVHSGVQMASLMNITGFARGCSMAGMMNIAGTAKGSQLAGMANINDTLYGVAASGMFNISKCGKTSLQIAPVFNISDNGSSALQLGALFNKTSYLRGVQIGMLNFADSANGVPIGFLSFVKKGVHQIELSADELFPLNLSFRTGVPAFYNIISVGYKTGSPLWQVGYGVGSSLHLKNKWYGEITATAHHLSNGRFYISASDLYRFYVGFEYKFKKRFSVAFGPQLNVYVSDTYDSDFTSIYNNIPPYHIDNQTNEFGFNRKMWLGGKIALRFL